MKSILFFTIIFLLNATLLVHAQFQTNNWQFGDDIALSDTSTGVTKVLDFRVYPYSIWTMPPPQKDYFLNEANTVISSLSGDLEFYSNGIDLYNAQHELVENGEIFPANPNQQEIFRVPQGALLLPFPSHLDSCIFLFTDYYSFQSDSGLTGGSHSLTYSVIDKTWNGNGGKVVERLKKLTPLDTLVGGQITACRHANGRDWWILTHKLEKNIWYRFLLGPEGFKSYPQQTLPGPMRNSAGWASYSPDGAWYAKYNYVAWPFSSWLDIFHFDRCTGLLSGQHHIQMSDRPKPGGVAFSPNSRFLYVSVWDSIYQYDLQAADIEGSKTTVAVYDGFTYDLVPDTAITYIVPTRFYLMGLAPDNRIYIAVPNVNSNYLHVIENPDAQGIACDVRQHSIYFNTTYSYTMTNVPHYGLGALVGSPCDTLGSVAEKQPIIDGSISAYPNPATEGFYLKSAGGFQENSVCFLYDALGRQLQKTLLQQKEAYISLANLPLGLYIYEIREENGRAIFRGTVVKGGQ